jgi:hypothetical protein
MVLFMIALLGVGMLIIQVGQSKFMAVSSCREIVQSSLNRIESLAYRPTTVNYVVQSNDLVGSPVGAPVPYGVSANARWPGLPEYRILDTTVAPFILRSPFLINGTMSALSQIYNSNIGYCAADTGMTYNGAGGQNLLMLSPISNISNSVVKIRIQPFDVSVNPLQILGSSGNPPCPAPPLFIRPESRIYLAQIPAYSTDYIFPTNVYAYGFYVTIFVDYTDIHGAVQSCSGSRYFNYPRDDLDPVQPGFNMVANNTVGRANCDASANHVEVSIQYPSVGGTKMEQGTVLVCRDSSTVNIAAYPSGTSCDFNGVPIVQYNPATRPWVLCDQVTICGKAPTSGMAGLNADGAIYDLVYDDVPWACSAIIDVEVIDVAGNSTDDPANSVRFLVKPAPCNFCASTSKTYCPAYVCGGGGDGGGDGGGGGGGGGK